MSTSPPPPRAPVEQRHRELVRLIRERRFDEVTGNLVWVLANVEAAQLLAAAEGQAVASLQAQLDGAREDSAGGM